MQSSKFTPLIILGLMASACSSESIESISQKELTSKVTLSFKVDSNSFSRAESEGNNIETLYLAFFNSSVEGKNFISLEKASENASQNGNLYSVELEIIPNKEPNLVIAFANINDVTLLKSAISSPVLIEDIQTNEGNLVMSSPRYFGSSHENIYFTSFDYTSTVPIPLDLERVGAKVTVSDNASQSNDGISPVEILDASGNKTVLNLSIDSWGVNATDSKSYIIRQIGTYDETATELGGWNDWNNTTTLFWAKSPNYSKDFSTLPEDVALISYSNASNEFSKSVFVHETTRKPSTDGLNSKPSIIIAGHYTIGDATESKTFYRFRNSIFTENEIYAYLLKKITGSVKINGGDLTDKTLKENFELKHIEKIGDKDLPSSYVTLQLKEGKEVSDFSGKEGESYKVLDNLNKSIAEKCGAFEMFKNGKCFFSVPIEHNRENGIYGIVRNHHYSISINSISGIGGGVFDENSIITETPEFEEGTNNYNISFSLKIRDWEDVSQDVSIAK